MTDREVAQRLNTALNNALDRAQVAERERDELKVQRDELKARIEAVKVSHSRPFPGSHERMYGPECIVCRQTMPCATFRTLHGGVS